MVALPFLLLEGSIRGIRIMNENEQLTKSDLKEFEVEILENLKLQLAKAKEQFEAIKKEQEFDENKKSVELIKHNSKKKGISIKSYIEKEAVDEFSKKKLLNLCQDEIKSQTKNFSDDEVSCLIESDSMVDGHGIMVIKKTIPKREEIPVQIKNGEISRSRY